MAHKKYDIRDFENKRYGSFLCTGVEHGSGRDRLFEFRCDCGRIAKKRMGQIKQLTNSSCCFVCTWKKNPPPRHTGASHPKYSGYGEITGLVYRRAFNSAKIRKIRFDITIIDMDVQWKKQKCSCALTGELLTMGTRKEHTASIDRINSDLPYSVDNIQWVHKVVNKMKNDIPQSKFIELCRSISRYYDDQLQPSSQ